MDFLSIGTRGGCWAEVLVPVTPGSESSLRRAPGSEHPGGPAAQPAFWMHDSASAKLRWFWPDLMTLSRNQFFFFFLKGEKIIWPDSIKHEAFKVLCYEKKTLCVPHAKHICCSLFIKVLNFLSSVTQILHSTSENSFLSITTRIFCITASHVQLPTSVRTPTKQVLAGLNTGCQMFCAVRFKSLWPHTHC